MIIISHLIYTAIIKSLTKSKAISQWVGFFPHNDWTVTLLGEGFSKQPYNIMVEVKWRGSQKLEELVYFTG